MSGIGLSAGVAHRIIAALETHFDVLGGAATAGPPTPEDAMALLDAAGAEQAHIVGLSFGATIAQEIAIRHPVRVSALVLCSSTAGGERYFPPEPQVREFLRRLDERPAEEGLWASVPYLYAPTTWRRHAPRVGEDVAERLRHPLDPGEYRRQHATACAHDRAAHLAEITAPTLVVHGQEDRILPLDNGRRLAAGIPGARFMSLRRAGHAFPTDLPDSANELVSFLVAHSRRRPGSTASNRSGRVTRA